MKAILFDLDGTLTDRTASIRMFAERFIAAQRDRISPAGRMTSEVCNLIAAADEAGYAPRSAVCAALRDGMPWTRRPGVEELVDLWRGEFPNCTVPCAGMRETLGPLRASGIRLGLVTNGNAHGQRRKLEVLKITTQFDVVVISDEVGLRKPDPAIFRFALEQLRVCAADAWFVGDHPVNDVAAAQAVGTTAVWLRGLHDWPAELPPPAHAIERLEELLPLVEDTAAP